MAAVGTAAIGTLAYIAASTASAGDEAAKAAKRLGLTAEEFQELSFAAQRSGAEIQVMEVALRTVARMAAQAKDGLGAGKLAFEKLGIEVVDANGELKRTPALLSEAAEALSGLSNETEQIALAQDIFGRGGSQLLPLLLEGADGIDELRKKARELGFVLDSETSRDAEQFQDSLLDAQLAAGSLKTTIGAALLPVGIELLDWIKDVSKALRPYVEDFLEATDNTIGLKNVLAGLVVVTGALTLAAATLGGVLGLGAVAAAMSTLYASAGVLLPVLGAVAGLFLPIIATVAQLGVAFLVVEDFFHFMTGGKSVVGEFVDKFAEADGPFGAFAQAFIKIRDVISSVLTLGASLADLFTTILLPVLTAFEAVFGPLGAALLSIFGAAALEVLGVWADQFIAALTTIEIVILSITEGIEGLISGIRDVSALASGVSLPSFFGGGGGTTNNSTTNNVSANLNAPISTTASASETATAIGDGFSSLVRRAMPDFLGAEQ